MFPEPSKYTKKQKECNACSAKRRLTKHHLKEERNGKYARTGETITLCRTCHDRREKADLVVLEQALITRVKDLMKAKRGGQTTYINRRLTRLIRALERLKGKALERQYQRCASEIWIRR